MNKNEMFKGVVTSALEFLDESCSQVETKPKFAVIHFCTAVELFLKARLMKEHWSLIIEDVGKTNLTKFQQGDFISVGMKEALVRLKSIVGADLSQDEKNALDPIREHRNKLVHFFNPDHRDPAKPGAIATIVAEQCRAWYFLHKLLTGTWRKHFKPYLTAIEKMNLRMHKLRSFLQAKHKALQPVLKEQKLKGIKFSKCPACGFKATRDRTLLGPLTVSECLVCQQRHRFLIVPCPECGESIISEELGEGKCDCGETIDMEFLFDKYGDHPSLDEQLAHASHAYCSSCEEMSDATVVPTGGRWLCLNCLETFDFASDCEWCSSYIAGLSK